MTDQASKVVPAESTTSDPTPSVPAERPAVAARPRWARRDEVVARLLVVVAVVPVVVATVRALIRGWAPIGDIGLILLRAEDVGTANHPLLGTWTSASLAAERNINNPGPLWFDVLAPFVRVFGPSAGTALAVMVSNVAAIVIAAWAAKRAGGTTGLLIVTALSAGLTWTLGSELLFDAWQPNAMVLPFWALLVTLWALSTGTLSAAPWAIGIGSLIVQTHLSFIYAVAVLSVASAVAAAVWWRLDRRHADSAAATAPSWRRPLGATAVVGLLAWVQPLIDQFAGQGNLGNLLTSSGDVGERIGSHLGVRFVSSVVALPPWWTRPSYNGTIVPTGLVGAGVDRDVAEGQVASMPVAILGLLVVLAVLAAVVVFAVRRGDRAVGTLAGLGALAVVTAVAALVLSPLNSIGVSPHQMRWLWPISTLVLAAPLVAAGRWADRPRVVTTVAGVATVVAALVALPTYAAPDGPTASRDYEATVSDVVDQLQYYDPPGPVVFSMTGIRFAEPYSGPVIAALARNGVDVVSDDEGMVGQMGSRRRADDTVTRELVLAEGAAAFETPPGAQVVAFVDGLEATERDELNAVRAQLLELLTADGVRLNAEGRAARDAGRFDVRDDVVPVSGDATDLEAFGVLTQLIDGGYVELDATLEPVATRYAELAQRASTYTVGLFERPR